MTSANVFNLNSVKQGQVLNANAAKGRSKAENPDAAGVFASLMGSNYSTNFNMPSVDTKINNNVLQQTNAADNYDRYQYQDNTIRQAALIKIYSYFRLYTFMSIYVKNSC